MKTLEEIFGKPISVYTDEEAVDDGTLVAINSKDRITRPVWDWLVSTMDMKNPKPPSHWPVNLFGYFGAKTKDERVRSMCEGIIDVNRKQAMRVYEENIGGGFFQLWVSHEGGYKGRPISVDDKDQVGGQMRLWFVPNGAGLTLMFPEDY
jgi:hypothetical protein